MVIKIGIVGMGFMGRMHLSSYAKMKDVKVVAFADINEKVRTGTGAGAGNLGDTGFKVDVKSFNNVYATGRELINDSSIDLVDICVPTPSHKSVFVDAVASGKYVIVEKPLARSEADINAMLAAGKKAANRVMVAQCIRFWPAYVHLKSFVDNGKLGKCCSVILRRQGARGLWSPWYKIASQSGGALYDLHVHDTDYMNFLFGKPKSVMSVGSKGQTSDSGVDHVVTNYQYPSSIVEAATAIGAWSQHEKWPFFMGFTAVFEKATLEFNGAKLLKITNKDTQEIKCSPTDGWFEELKYFTGCVKKGAAPELNLITSTADTMKIVLAEERSVKSGKIEKV